MTRDQSNGLMTHGSSRHQQRKVGALGHQAFGNRGSDFLADAPRRIDSAHEGKSVFGQSTDESFPDQATESVDREYDVGVLARVGLVVSEVRGAQILRAHVGGNQAQAGVVLGMKGGLTVAINSA